MRVFVLWRYAWLRLARAHYLKALFGMAFFVGGAVAWTNTEAITPLGQMSSLELGMKVARTFLWLAAVWIGAGALAGEISAQTARTLMTKPVSRFEIAVGMLGGGFAYLALMIVIFAAEIHLICWWRGIPVDWRLEYLLLTLLVPLVAVMAMAQLFSLLAARPVAIFFAVLLSFESLGRSLAERLEAGDVLGAFQQPAAAAAHAVYLAMPTYGRFVMSYTEFSRIGPAVGPLLFHSAAALLYALGIAAFSSFVLSRKDV
ncbi:MAG: hypothetical protein M5R36_25670 [Deltaproteobacteria bacterium]|nr:hypothetical protein [Deltaproteobacteria bacterium]